VRVDRRRPDVDGTDEPWPERDQPAPADPAFEGRLAAERAHSRCPHHGTSSSTSPFRHVSQWGPASTTPFMQPSAAQTTGVVWSAGDALSLGDALDAIFPISSS